MTILCLSHPMLNYWNWRISELLGYLVQHSCQFYELGVTESKTVIRVPVGGLDSRLTDRVFLSTELTPMNWTVALNMCTAADCYLAVKECIRLQLCLFEGTAKYLLKRNSVNSQIENFDFVPQCCLKRNFVLPKTRLHCYQWVHGLCWFLSQIIEDKTFILFMLILTTLCNQTSSFENIDHQFIK